MVARIWEKDTLFFEFFVKDQKGALLICKKVLRVPLGETGNNLKR